MPRSQQGPPSRGTRRRPAGEDEPAAEPCAGAPRAGEPGQDAAAPEVAGEEDAAELEPDPPVDPDEEPSEVLAASEELDPDRESVR